MIEAAMPVQKTRTRRKDARPSEITAAAMTLFAERGFAATRLEDVAAAAGIGKGTIYLYFSNKEELFQAVVRQRLLPRLDIAEALIRRHKGTTTALLRTIIGWAEKAIESDIAAIPKLVLTEAGNFPEIARFYGDVVVKRGLCLLAMVIARGVERGEFRPVDPWGVMPLFVAPVLMMALWKHSLGRHTDIQLSPRLVLGAHIDMLLRGLAPEKQP